MVVTVEDCSTPNDTYVKLKTELFQWQVITHRVKGARLHRVFTLIHEVAVFSMVACLSIFKLLYSSIQNQMMYLQSRRWQSETRIDADECISSNFTVLHEVLHIHLNVLMNFYGLCKGKLAAVVGKLLPYGNNAQC